MADIDFKRPTTKKEVDQCEISHGLAEKRNKKEALKAELQKLSDSEDGQFGIFLSLAHLVTGSTDKLHKDLNAARLDWLETAALCTPTGPYLPLQPRGRGHP